MSQTEKSRPSSSPSRRPRVLPVFSRTRVGLVLALLLVFGIVGISKINMVQDITALLPDKSGNRMSLVELARSSGLMKKVVILLGPSDLPLTARGPAMDLVVGDLTKLDGVRDVVSKIDEQEVRRAATILMDHSSRLRGRAPDELDSEEVTNRLLRLKKNLSTAEAMVTGQYMLADPLSFSRHALSGLSAAAESMGAIEKGYLVSKDRRYVLALVDIDFNPLDVERSKSFVKDLDDSIRKSLDRSGLSQLKFIHLGGVHFAASSASAIMGDVQIAFLLTACLVVAVFLYFFRRVRLLPAALLPGGIGIATAIGVMGIASVPLHALTLGFAATITGISVDYAIHLLKRASFETQGNTRQKMEKALSKTGRPIALGCLTTFGAFVLVATSGFTGIRQLAVFASISIPIAMLVTLFALPAFHGFLLGGKARSAPTGLHRFVEQLVGDQRGKNPLKKIVLFALLLSVSAIGVFKVSLSGDPKDLRALDPELESRQKVLGEVFPGLADHALIVASANSKDAVLDMNDTLYERLLEEGTPAGHIVSISPFLPSLKTQEASLESVKALFNGKDDLSLRELFTSAGFKESYFERLASTLDHGPLTKETFEGTGLKRIIEDSFVKEGDYYHVVTRLRAQNKEQALRLKTIAASVDGCALVSERLEIEEALTMLQKELVWMLATWLVAALVVLTIVERSPLFGLRAALPAIFGVAVSVALFGFLDRPLTPVASAGVTLVMGLGIDYGIFMQSGRGDSLGRVAFAVTASALTTIAGFGVLTIARTRAMADIGLIVLVGVFAAFITAMWLLPALGRSGYKSSS